MPLVKWKNALQLCLIRMASGRRHVDRNLVAGATWCCCWEEGEREREREGRKANSSKIPIRKIQSRNNANNIMYRPQQQTRQYREEDEAPTFQYIPKNGQTESHLKKFMVYENAIEDLIQTFRVCQSSAEKRIAAFSSSTRTLGLQPEYYRNSAQGTKRDYDNYEIVARHETLLSPRAQFHERENARLQLPQCTADLERQEMEQAQYLLDLKQKCEKQFPHHDYVVFTYQNDPSPDLTDLRCLRCFDANGNATAPQNPPAGASWSPNQTVRLYPSSVDFHGKMMRQGGISSMGTLQALF